MKAARPRVDVDKILCQVTDIRLNPDDIWTPDLEVYNLRERKFLASEGVCVLEA